MEKRITVSEIIFEGGYKACARAATRKESCSNISASYNVGIKYFQPVAILVRRLFSVWQRTPRRAFNTCYHRIKVAFVARKREREREDRKIAAR